MPALRLVQSRMLWQSAGTAIAPLGTGGSYWFLAGAFASGETATGSTFSASVALPPPANSIHSMLLDNVDDILIEYAFKVTALSATTPSVTVCTIAAYSSLQPQYDPAVDYLGLSMLERIAAGLALEDTTTQEATWSESALLLGGANIAQGVADENASGAVMLVGVPLLQAAASSGRPPTTSDFSRGYVRVGKKAFGSSPGVGGGMTVPAVSTSGMRRLVMGTKFSPVFTGTITSITIAGAILAHLYREIARTR